MILGVMCCYVVLFIIDGYSGIVEVKDRDGWTLYYEFYVWGLFWGVDGELEVCIGV